MSSSRATLERIGTRVPVPQPAYDRMMRRRDRKRRNQRIATAVLALILAAVAIGGAIRVIGVAERQRPASITPDNVKDLRLAWSATLDGAPSDVHAPSLTLDRVYPPTVADGSVYVGSATGKLYAFDETCVSTTPSCKPTWVADVGNEISDPPTVADGEVFVSANGGGLFAFAEDCGSGGSTCLPLWTASTGRAIASPVVAGGIVYGIDPVNGTLNAFRADCGSGGATCEPLWTRSTEPTRAHPTTLKWVDFRPAVSGGVVYALGKGRDDRLYAFDAVTGLLLWHGDTAKPASGSIGPFDTPLVAGDVVLALLGNGLQAFSVNCGADGGSCKPLWVIDGFGGPPIVKGDSVFSHGFSDFSTGEITAFGLHCGTGGARCRPSWTGTDGGWGGTAAGSGIVASTAYHGNTVHAFPANCTNPCEARWSAMLPEPRDPLVADGLVFVPTADGNLYAFSATCATGGAKCEPDWTAPGISGQPSPPVIDGARLFVSTLDGKLYSFSLPSSAKPAASNSSSAPTFVFYLGLAAAAAILIAVRRARRRAS